MATQETRSAAPRLYTLTKYTRDGPRNRRTVIQGFDIPLRKMLITLIGVAVSLLPTVFAAVFVAYWAALIPVVCVTALLWLVEHRTRDGLRVPVWRAIHHRRQEPINEFLCGGGRVDPLATGYCRVLPSSVRVHPQPSDPLQLFAALPADPVTAAARPTVDRGPVSPAGPSPSRDSWIRVRRVAGRVRRAARVGAPTQFPGIG